MKGNSAADLLKVVTESGLEQIGISSKKSEKQFVKHCNRKIPRLPEKLDFDSTLTIKDDLTSMACINSAMRFLIFSKLSALSTSGSAAVIRPAAVWHIDSHSSSTY